MEEKLSLEARLLTSWKAANENFHQPKNRIEIEHPCLILDMPHTHCPHPKACYQECEDRPWVGTMPSATVTFPEFAVGLGSKEDRRPFEGHKTRVGSDRGRTQEPCRLTALDEE